MSRVKQKTVGSYTFTSTPLNDEGSTAALTVGVTGVLKDGAGVVIPVGTSPTIVAGVATWVVSASLLPLLDTYTITWTGTVAGVSGDQWVSEVEIVGGFHFTIAQLRAVDRVFSDMTKYPSAILAEVRSAVEDVIEGPRAAQVSFVPRGRRVALNGVSPDLSRGYNPLLYGADYRSLYAPDYELRVLRSVIVGGTALTKTELDSLGIDDNEIARVGGIQFPAWPHGKGNIVLHYEHGRDSAPRPINRAALILAREYLTQTELPGRATATSIGDQMFRLTIAGRDGLTGLPEVDAAIAQHGRFGYGIG